MLQPAAVNPSFLWEAIVSQFAGVRTASASEIQPDDLMWLRFSTSVYVEKMIIVANWLVTCGLHKWTRYEAILIWLEQVDQCSKCLVTWVVLRHWRHEPEHTQSDIRVSGYNLLRISPPAYLSSPPSQVFLVRCVVEKSEVVCAWPALSKQSQFW